MTKKELSAAQDRIKNLVEPLTQEEQKVLYLYLFHLGQRVHDSQMFVSKILGDGQ